jgi:hypothetical protein
MNVDGALIFGKSGSYAYGSIPSAQSYTDAMTLDAGGNLSVGTTNNPNGSRVIVRGTSATGGYNSTFTQANSTAQIIGDEMGVNQWYPTFNITTVRQSLTTGNGGFGGIGFSTIDDSNNTGMDDAGRIAIINESGGSVASPTAMAFYTQVGSSTRTNAATERMRIRSNGQLLVGTTSAVTDAYLGTAYPAIVSSSSFAYRPIDGNGAASLVSKAWSTSPGNTYTVTVIPSDSVYAIMDIRVGGYSSSGSGSASAYFAYGGHVGAYQLNTVFNISTGNVVISAPSIAGGGVRFTITITGGQGGIYVVKVSDAGNTSNKTAWITVT